jgi:hypothetical protein
MTQRYEKNAQKKRKMRFSFALRPTFRNFAAVAAKLLRLGKPRNKTNHP